MPSIPPFARSESIADYAAQCKGVEWRERRIKAADGVEVAVAVSCGVQGSKVVDMEEAKKEAKREAKKQTHVAIVYFQGSDESTVNLVLWGQSIGAGVATSAAAALASIKQDGWNRAADIKISGLLLETPFVSVLGPVLAESLG
ncbi:MAG: hypothetical protein Q9220_005219 [cf. Caloplaca sp. 1 TL-2023]